MTTARRHLAWTREGRKLVLGPGLYAYTGSIAQQNIELPDGTYAPYVWNDDARVLRYADVEARFRGGSVEFWRDGTLQAVTRPRLQRRTRHGWVDEEARVRVERLSDEDELESMAFARVAIVLESERATARHILVAGCRSRARGDTQLIAHLPGEYRVVLEHDLGGPIETSRQPLASIPSAGCVAHTSALGWRVAWTLEEDRDRSVRVTDRGLAIELAPLRRARGQRRPAEQWVSPDTYGPILNAGGGNDGIADGVTVLLNGWPVADGVWQWWIGIDDTDIYTHINFFRFGGVDLDGSPTIHSASLFNQRAVDRGSGNHTVRVRCQASNTPTTPTGDISIGENPLTRVYLSEYSDCLVPQSSADLTMDVTTAVQGCIAAGYSYTGDPTHAIFFGCGGSQWAGISTVSYAHLAWDAAHPTYDPAQLTIVYSDGAPPPGDMEGSTAATATATATLTGSGALAGSSAGAATATGTLSGAGALAGSAAGSATAAGTLTGAAALAGTSAGASAASGDLTGAGALSGTSAGTATASATLTAAGALSGAATASATASGALTGAGALAGTSSGVAAASGALTAQGALSGVAAGAATASGTLHNATPTGELSGTVSCSCTVSGRLAATGALSGTASSSSSAAATLRGDGALSGTVQALALAAGVLLGVGALGGSATASATARGTLTDATPPVALAGTVRCTSSATGSLTGTGALSGTITVTSMASGALTSEELAPFPEGVPTVAGLPPTAEVVVGDNAATAWVDQNDAEVRT